MEQYVVTSKTKELVFFKRVNCHKKILEKTIEE